MLVSAVVNMTKGNISLPKVARKLKVLLSSMQTAHMINEFTDNILNNIPNLRNSDEVMYVWADFPVTKKIFLNYFHMCVCV